MPLLLPSPPEPDFLIPPKGISAAAITRWFAPTIPVSSPSEARKAVRVLCVKMYATRPNSVALVLASPPDGSPGVPVEILQPVASSRLQAEGEIGRPYSVARTSLDALSLLAPPPAQDGPDAGSNSLR
jgi:hypothetical protein